MLIAGCRVLAMSMLPEGAEMQVNEWTIFFLNQTPFNTISPVVGLDSPDLKTARLPGEGTEPDLLCVFVQLGEGTTLK